MAQIVSLLGPGWIVATLLLAARIAAVLLLTPVLHAVPIPPLVRVLAILGIACLLAMPLAGTVAPAIHDTGALLQAMVREALVGATLGLGVLMGFAGFTLAATVVRGGSDLFQAALPRRLVYVLGAEGEGMSPELAAACDLRMSIPGTGAVESLNVAAATAVLLAAWARGG